MSEVTRRQPPREVVAPVRFHYDTPEFGRVANLSDGVFAIALTLLVLTLDVPDVPADQLARALLDEAQQVVIFGLSFLLVANIWWVHHRLVGQLAFFESGLIALNLVMLGLVALVPFPTSLVGASPTVGAAVLPFIAVFLAITLVHLGMTFRARRLDAWRREMPDGVFPWLVAGWAGQIAGMIIAMVATIWLPILGLAIVACTGLVVWTLVGVFGPPAHREWV
jgi:uncharacterized membrane protein